MRPLLALLLLQAFSGTLVHAKEQLLEVVVAEPYLEMHSGPGRGYPVVYVVGRDEVVTVLYSRTDWFKVRAPRGQEGWARRSELALTKLASGEAAPIPPYPEFATHRWEMGAGYGVFNHQNLVTTWGDFGLTDSLDIEFVLQQALGTVAISPAWGFGTPSFPNGVGFRPRPASARRTSTSTIRYRRSRSRAAIKWPTFRWGRAASLPGDSCGVLTGASTRSSPTKIRTRNRKNGNSA